MTDVLEFDKASRVRSEASLWIVRLQEGIDKEQQCELENWLALDSMHQSEFLELAAVWDELEQLTELAPLFEGVPTRQMPSTEGEKLLGLWGWKGMPAAMVLLSALLIVVVLLGRETNLSGVDKQGSEVVGNNAVNGAVKQLKEISTVVRYATALGEQRELLLSDGSRATLNTDTLLEVSFTKEQRTISLLKGEVHFEVFKDTNRPLVVLVSGKSVKAVGTAFSVRKNTNSEFEVAVDEGRVAVYQLTADAVQLGQQVVASLAASLSAGEVLTIEDNAQRVTRYERDEMVDRLAWREGMIVINDETLEYVIQEFGRHNEQKLLLADRQMGNIRVAGYFRLGDVGALLLALENNFGIRSEYYRNNETYVLSPK